MKKVIAFISLVSVLFLGCKTDFEVNAVWKETTIVYGLLDVNKAVQMIKINKAFLGEGDANQYAQIPDSSNYNPADLEVLLFQQKNGITTKTITLHDSILPGKNPGAFTTQKNMVFVTYVRLDSSCIYKLEIKNLKTGNICSASTPILETVPYNKIGSKSPAIAFSTSPSSPFTNGVYSDPLLTWTSKPNARTYQTNVRFYYTEKNLTTGIIVAKYLDWLQGPVLSSGINGGEALQQKISGQAFYQYLQSQIVADPNGNFERKVSSVEFTMSVGSEELNNYINVNSPSDDLNQDKPVFTNISNGLGIFSSRTSYKAVRYMCNVSLSPPILCNSTNSTMAELVDGKYTNKLGFEY